ncbi:hypothetical protein F0L17_06650 [Streptomyces sp. TRM43335]|uniref:Uncharacterized protein n=1 Tax=Streptomyces taklimakanensis TaxID=2569853 RepID=A0A6G2B986_9ACTN|nr:hypothetical protein [Streptomyces taklimakanensis]MTE18818.1 hypothetical protein [Streptomyces taklimakanensis]
MLTVVPAELALVVCLAAGVAVPVPLVVFAEVLVGCALGAEAVTVARLWRRARGRGLGRREAARAAVRGAVPAPVRRLVAHELLVMASLARWVVRRPHGVGAGDTVAGYAAGQAPLVYGLLFVTVVETVGMAVLLPWPVVHLVVLVLDGWGAVMLLGLHAACAVRPHVVGADGSLRVRYGALVDVRVPAGLIVSARVEHRFPSGRLLRVADGVMELVVGGRTTVTVELDTPVEVVRPLGGRERARVVRFCADDPRATVAALREAGGVRTASAG